MTLRSCVPSCTLRKKLGQFDSLGESSSCPKKYPHWGVKMTHSPKSGSSSESNWPSFFLSVDHNYDVTMLPSFYKFTLYWTLFLTFYLMAIFHSPSEAQLVVMTSKHNPRHTLKGNVTEHHPPQIYQILNLFKSKM